MPLYYTIHENSNFAKTVWRPLVYPMTDAGVLLS